MKPHILLRKGTLGADQGVWIRRADLGWRPKLDAMERAWIVAHETRISVLFLKQARAARLREN